MEAALLMELLGAARNLPGAPDALAFVESLVEDVVLAEVALAEMAATVGEIIAATDDELADQVAAFAGHVTFAKGEAELHQVAARD